MSIFYISLQEIVLPSKTKTKYLVYLRKIVRKAPLKVQIVNVGIYVIDLG
jgi:hypothetical protein